MKPMKFGRYLTLIFLFVVYIGDVSCQTNSNLEKTVEFVRKVDGLNGTVFIGFDNRRPIFLKVVDQLENDFAFYVLNEKEFELSRFEKSIRLPVTKSDWKTGFLRIEKYVNDFWVYTIGYANDDYSIYYQDLWLQFNGRNYKLDSIYNSDKKIQLTVSKDEKYLIVNTLNPLSDYYNANQDNQFSIFSLDEIKKTGKVTKRIIPCQFCSDGYLIDQEIVFTKSDERDDFDGGYAWTDIYRAVPGKLMNGEKIVAFSDIVAISPDGKYILAKRIGDLVNGPRAIVDVLGKKYQLLLGRDYSKAQTFYSYIEDKFVFQFGDRIVYIDFPKVYPFDARRRNNSDIPHPSNKEFYKRFVHPSFE